MDDSAAVLGAGGIDAFFFSSGLPAAAIHDLGEHHRVRLVDLGEYVTGLRARFGELYTERSVPHSVYGLPATGTIGVPNYLVVHADMDDDLAYALTDLLFTARETLSAAHPEASRVNLGGALATYPVPLHPGAARYYREARRS